MSFCGDNKAKTLQKGVDTILFLYLFWLGGLLYQIIELLWRGYTHWSMFLAGGLSLIISDGIFTSFSESLQPFFILLLCGTAITCIEFFFGCLFNLRLKMNVWDYSDVKGNLIGQICPVYTLYWCALSLPAIGFAQLIRYLFL